MLDELSSASEMKAGEDLATSSKVSDLYNVINDTRAQNTLLKFNYTPPTSHTHTVLYTIHFTPLYTLHWSDEDISVSQVTVAVFG